MRSATRVLLAAFALVWGGSAAAQNDVTFQVDLNPYITTCQFSPQLNGVTVPGSANGWDTAQFPLADGNGDGIYTGTYSLADSTVGTTINFKYYVTNNPVLSWENDPNRAYTVTAGAQTVPLSTFNGPAPTDACSATDVNYDIIFEVDMSIQQGRGLFNPGAGDVVGVNGQVPNGWDNPNPIVLTEDSFRPGVYTGIFERTVLAPSATGFKFVVRKADGVISWESVDPAVTPDNSGGGDANRIIRVTGLEVDADGNGRRDFVYDNDNNSSTPVFFGDAGADDFLAGDATVTFNVDMRPARFLLADTGALPGGATTLNRVAINGPAAGESQQDSGPGGGLGDWAAWGDVLNATESRQLTDADGDDIWTITLNYGAGARRDMVAKFGVNGLDNESGFAGDHRFPITEGAQTVSLNFGCIRQANGTFSAVSGSGGSFASYQPYLLIDNSVPSCTVVRSGGGVGAEGGPQIAGLEISGAYPNPSTGVSRIALTLDTATDVSVRVFDVTGRQVAVAAEGFRAAGASTVEVDTRGFAAGLYVVRVEANGSVVSRRLTVAR